MRELRPGTAVAELVVCGMLCGASAAQVPNAISYQGVLLDPGGQPTSAASSLRFRIYRGGDDVTFPSSGSLVYHERATVLPVDGVFSHLIGTGTSAADCVGGTCVLGADTFGPGTVPVWIEVTLDPDGVVGSADDDVLLPRTRVGTVGYAYRVASLDGATGGDMTGTIVADEMVARGGAVLGDAEAASSDLRFDAAGGSTTVTWDPAASELSFDQRTRHERGLTLDPSKSIAWGPLPGNGISPHLRFSHWTSLVGDGNLDGQPDTRQTFSLCYNCQEAGSAVEVPSEYSVHWLWDMTGSFGPGDRSFSQRLNFVPPGQSAFQPYVMTLDPNFLGGYANPTAKWSFRTSRTRTALSINQNGNVLVGSEAFQPAYPLDVVGSIHSNDDLILERGKQLRFGTSAALSTDAAGTTLGIGAGFPAVQVLSPATFAQGLTLAGGGPVSWGPFTNPVPGTYIRQITTGALFSDGNLDGTPDFDHVWGLCYNCRENSAVPDVQGEYQMIAQWEMTYAPANGTRWIEHNWDFRDPASNQFRPLAFFLDTDRAGGYANPRAGWSFATSKSKVALNVNSNGNVRIGADSPAPQFPLEVSGTVRADGDVRVGGASGVYLGTKKALSTGPTGALVLGQDHDVVGIGTASLAVSVCAPVQSATQIAIADCNVVQLGGGASIQTIDTCNADRAGRVLYVLCGAAGAQLCDSCGTGNLRLSAILTCTVDDTITLLCDGAVWKELGRSVN